MPAILDPVVRSISLRVSAEEAFETWWKKIHLWWPVKRISVTKQAASQVMMEGKVGGRLFEKTGDGAEHDWGRVIRWEPPTLLVYEWFLDADPKRATEVEVHFTEEVDGTTTVRVNHGKWENAAEDIAEVQRSCVAAPEGWSGILDLFEKATNPTKRGEL
jgi:uncharacterized protein YndB with AHSA1/START domain